MGFPLSHVEAGRPLPLLEGVNPAWVGALAALHEKAVTPLLGPDVTFLTAEHWSGILSKFSAYEAWLGENGGRAVEKIGLARTKEILAGRGARPLPSSWSGTRRSSRSSRP